MKHTILYLALAFLFTVQLHAQQMDKRAMPERKADYEKFIEYPSGFSDSNTKAAADTLVCADQWMVIDYSPLCDFKQITPALTKENAPLAEAMQAKKPPFCFWEQIPSDLLCYPAHNCRRGFIANWEIRGNKLYLKNLRLWTPDLLWQSVVKFPGQKQPETDVPQEELLARLEKTTKRSFNAEGLLFADWFTGTLLGETINRNLSDDYRTKNIRIDIEKGEIKEFSARRGGYRSVPICGGNFVLFFDEAQHTFNNLYTIPLK